MRSCGKLVSKEQAKSNFKLTFENEQGQLWLFLNQSKEIIFNNLEIGNKYDFSASKGIKNYYFINPQSIKIVEPLNIPNPLLNSHINETKDFYYNKLLKEIGVKKLDSQHIEGKIERLKELTQKIKKQSDKEYLLILIKELITSFYFKYRVLGTLGQSRSKEEEKEEELLLEIETILFFDKTYNKKD
jgi:hypothetical protein